MEEVVAYTQLRICIQQLARPPTAESQMKYTENTDGCGRLIKVGRKFRAILDFLQMSLPQSIASAARTNAPNGTPTNEGVRPPDPTPTLPRVIAPKWQDYMG